MYVRRRVHARRLVVLGVGAAVGLTAAVIAGVVHPGPHSAVLAPAPVTTVAACQVQVHSPAGAAKDAADGLAALQAMNLGPIDATPERRLQVEQTLTRYVTPEQRPLERLYLQTYPANYQSIVVNPVAWRQVAYDGTTAVIQVATVVVDVTPQGVTETTHDLTTVPLTYDPLAGFWRIAVGDQQNWKVVPQADISDLMATGEKFCAA